ncbi:MAG: hypothetical protein HEQ24_16655 [Dolichospermum sp. BR01]|nr:hypothetical protein [Dolichospermum sp. BR01]
MFQIIINSTITGRKSQESGVRSQESGVRSQESGVRSQEFRSSRMKNEEHFPPMGIINDV